jgi:dihydrofolate synthase/folylpolyglutamate synthase
MLGETLPEIAFEKAGIIKPCVPVVIGESHPETDPVFERKVLYTNLPEPKFMGNRNAIMSLLTFADKVEPTLWDKHEEILAAMDLQGEYQCKNLRTALAALDNIFHASAAKPCSIPPSAVGSATLLQENRARCLQEALVGTAARTGFRGRWEKISDNPLTICDIGHNEHGLKYNFAQLERMKDSGEYTHLIIVYGSVADKDVDSVIHLMPEGATYVFTQASSKRALAASEIYEKYKSFCDSEGRPYGDVFCCDKVESAVEKAKELAASDPSALIYVGGSTYVVSETVALLNHND